MPSNRNKSRRSQEASDSNEGDNEMTDTTTEEAPPSAEGATATAAPAKKRDELPEGVVTPVGFAHAIKTHRGVEVRPQVIYGYVKNNKAFGALVTKHTDGRNILEVSKGLEWWDAKERAKAEKAAATPDTTADAPPAAE